MPPMLETEQEEQEWPVRSKTEVREWKGNLSRKNIRKRLMARHWKHTKPLVYASAVEKRTPSVSF
jgi:hypothetical protein